MALREIVLELGVEVDEGDVDKATGALDSLKGAAIKVGAVFATGALAVGFNKLIEFGSRAEERLNKFNAVFVESADNVSAGLAKISADTGVANPLLEEFAANIGAVVKPALGSAEAAGKMGVGIAGLALDIASFFDKDPEEAFVALRAGLIGSSEPLNQFGIDTRVAALEAEALRQGITKSVKAMSAGEKTTLRYATIVRSLSESGGLGDAAKTSEGFANATRGLNSQLKFLGEILGGFLIEDAAKTAVNFRKIVGAVNAWLIVNRDLIQQRVNDVLQVINNTFEGIFIAVKFVIGGFQQLAKVIGPVATGVLIAAGAIAVLLAVLGAPVVAVLALVALLVGIIDDLVVFSKGGKSVFGVLVEGAKEFLDQFIDVDAVIDDFTSTIENLATLWQEVVDKWSPVLAEFFTSALEKVKEFSKKGIKSAIELFTGLAATLEKALKTIFGGTVGRIIIDFLGAKAGAVVGEFIGRLVGQLAGKIVGKGIVGRAISSKFGQELFGLAGKGVGAIAGGLKADEFALSLADSINKTPAAIGGAPAGIAGPGNFVQTNEVEFTMVIEGNADPAAVRTAAQQGVTNALTSSEVRQSAQDLQQGPLQ